MKSSSAGNDSFNSMPSDDDNNERGSLLPLNPRQNNSKPPPSSSTANTKPPVMVVDDDDDSPPPPLTMKGNGSRMGGVGGVHDIDMSLPFGETNLVIHHQQNHADHQLQQHQQQQQHSPPSSSLTPMTAMVMIQGVQDSFDDDNNSSHNNGNHHLNNNIINNNNRSHIPMDNLRASSPTRAPSASGFSDGVSNNNNHYTTGGGGGGEKMSQQQHSNGRIATLTQTSNNGHYYQGGDVYHHNNTSNSNGGGGGGYIPPSITNHNNVNQQQQHATKRDMSIFFNNGVASQLHPFGNSRLYFRGHCLCAKDFTSSSVVFVIIVTFTALFIYSWFDYGNKMAIVDERWAAAAAAGGGGSPTNMPTPSTSTTLPSSPSSSFNTDGYENCNGNFRSHLVPTIVQILLCVITTTAMFATVATNPGVLLKQVSRNARNHKPPPGHIDYIEINGIQVLMPYCATCNIVRPPRSSHCIRCDNCVDCFDHHCGMIGACVGKRNFRQFLLFIYSMIIMSAWSMLWSSYLAWIIFPTDDTVNKVFCTAVAVTSFIILFLLSFMGVHYCKLIQKGFTQREFIKRDKLYPAGKNPFDDGCLRNWKEVCGI